MRRRTGRTDPRLRDRIAAAGDGATENRDEVRKVGIDLATVMGRRLIDEGAPCLHLCTLNFTRATSEVLANLGMAVDV